MGRRVRIIGVIAIAFFLGAACTFTFTEGLSRSRETNKWISVTSEGSGFRLNSDILGVDFSFPHTSEPTGKVKFLTDQTGTNLGYVLKLPIDPAPTSKFPPKYTRHFKLDNGIDVGPPAQLNVNGRFAFTLKDADGFVLVKVFGPTEHLNAASENAVQGTTDQHLPLSVVQRTKIVDVYFTALDCVPCDASSTSNQ